MASRSFWKGYLKLSLVTCRVAMMPARTDGEKVKFHLVNRQTGHRLESQYVDSVTRKPVDADDQAKAYERSEDDYVIVEDEDLDAVALESTRTIDVDTFVPSQSIQSIWYDQPHYLFPDDNVGEEAFAVIREAMRSTKTVGLARVVLYRRERAVMLQPRDKGIILWTLRYGDEVRDAPDVFTKAAPKSDARMGALLKRVIKENLTEWDPALSTDIVQERLRGLIESKKPVKKTAKTKGAKKPAGGNVINIMDALRKSVEQETKAPRKSKS